MKNWTETTEQIGGDKLTTIHLSDKDRAALDVGNARLPTSCPSHTCSGNVVGTFLVCASLAGLFYAAVYLAVWL